MIVTEEKMAIGVELRMILNCDGIEFGSGIIILDLIGVD